MSNVPAELQYTDQHEWVKLDGDVATVGITDYAQEALGDLVFVELPEVGKTFAKGDEMVVVESVKAASEVYAPLSGEVVELNETLADNSAQINTEPYAGGWVCKIRISNKDELSKLMDATKYQELIAD